MDDKLIDKVWKRDKGICKICKRKLTEIVLIDPYEDIAQALSALEEIPIFKWFRECWKCAEETPVVSYNFEAGFSYHIGDIEKLDNLLMQKYPFVKKIYSKTMGTEVIANTCVHCGSLQGNWFIMEDLIEMATEGREMNELIDLVLPINLTFEDLHIENKEPTPSEVKVGAGQVHHKDGNWENNDPSNLILLCGDCHLRIHSQLGKSLRPVRSRKTAREEARIRREKSLTDEWRKNYYARREKKQSKNR